MKITTSQLRQIIREELGKTQLKEANGTDYNGMDIFDSLRDKAFKEAESRIQKDLKGKTVEVAIHPKPPVVGKVLDVDLVEEYDLVYYEITLQTEDGKKIKLEPVYQIKIIK